MLADRVRMGVVRDSFDGILYKDGVGADLWTATVNPSNNSHNEILQTTPFLEINAPDDMFSYVSPIATKKKYDLSKFNTIKVKYELLSDQRTEGIKEGVLDISSLSDKLYILIVVVYAIGQIRMAITPSNIQNEVTFDFPSFIGETEYGWQGTVNRRCRIYELILE